MKLLFFLFLEMPSTTEMDIDFPRGGASTLTPLETRQVVEKAIAEFDANEAESTGSKGSKKRTRNKEKYEKAPKKPKTETVQLLTFKKLSVGMTLLGCVKEINDLDVVVSLPNQMTGFVPITEISSFLSAQIESAAQDSDEEDEVEADIPDLRRLFVVGQLLPCCIVALEDSRGSDNSKRRIELSLKAESVNSSLNGPDLSIGMASFQLTLDSHWLNIE